MATQKRSPTIAAKPIVNANNLITLLNAFVEGDVDTRTPGTSGAHLFNLGLVDRDGSVTARGQAHVTQLLRLALPERAEVWIDGQGNVIPS